MARSPTLLLAAALLLAAPALAACNREVSCSTEITAASGHFRGTHWGTRSEESLRRDSTQSACGQYCAAGGGLKTDGCISQCAADIASAKINARTTCSKKDSSSP